MSDWNPGSFDEEVKVEERLRLWLRQLRRQWIMKDWTFYPGRRPEFVTAPKEVFDYLPEHLRLTEDLLGNDLSEYGGTFQFRRIPIRCE